jgi:hypothetical protein
MKYLDTSSLFQTVDHVSEALLFGLEIEPNEKTAIADFIINQHGKAGTYADMFAPTEYDLKHDLILFTGEKIKSNVGKCHMIGEEASRILRQLDILTDKVKVALQQADAGLLYRINESKQMPGYEYGKYCCKKCSCALWLNLSSGGLNIDRDLLKAGMAYLKRKRDDKGAWISFPYFYTLYILNEIDIDIVMDEMQYAAKFMKRWYRNKKTDENKYALRRNYIYEQILKKVNSN